MDSSIARRKSTQTSTLIVYQPQPIQGRETQPRQHPAHVRREFKPLALAGAGSCDHPPDTGYRKAQASSLLRPQEEYFNTRHSGEQTAKATLVTVPAPGSSAAPAQEAAEKRSYLQWVPSRICKHFPSMSSSSSLNTLNLLPVSTELEQAFIPASRG